MALYSAPPVPAYSAAATQDINTARPNQKNPFGSSTWTPPTTPGGQWTQTTTLTPAEQAALDKQQGIDSGLSTGAAAKTPWAVSAGAGPMDYSKFMAGGSRVNGGTYYDQKAGDAVYKQFSDRMEPEFKRATSAMDVQLRNQGLKPGDEAYDTQMKSVAQEQGDQRQRARQDATMTAATEGSRMQGMDIGAGNYDTEQRKSQIAQELQKRGYGVDEINQMLQGHTIGMPNFAATPGQGSNYSRALSDTYSAQTDSSNAKNASTGSWLNLAGKVGSKVVDKYGGQIYDAAKSWLGFSPAATTALPMSAEAAAAANAANVAATTQIGTDIAAGANYGAAASGADAAATGATGAQAASSGGAAAGSGAGAVLGGVAAAAGAAIALKHLSDNTAGMGYRESRALASGIAENANNPDPTHGRGKYSSTPLSAPPAGFKTWNQYFYTTQIIQQSMHASGGKKDQGTYKMLLQEAGLPTDVSFYTQTHPGQEIAWGAIMGPNGLGTSASGRGGR